MANSYSNFGTFEEKPVRGKQTVNENLADIGGIKLAFSAYRSHLRRRGLEGEHRLPGLQQFNHEQMFWISYANVGLATTALARPALSRVLDLPQSTVLEFRLIFCFLFQRPGVERVGPNR